MCRCYEIGGPFIAEDPDCPEHGSGGLARQVEELKDALRATLEWIDAVPSDAVLPSMPGFDRDWVESLIER